MYGNYSATGAVVSPIASDYHFDIPEISVFTLLFLISGILTSFVYGALLDKYLCYKKLLVLICFLTGTVFFLMIFALPSGNKVAASAIFLLLGIAMIPIMGVSYAFSAELTYPIPDTLANGMMISISLVWGTL